MRPHTYVVVAHASNDAPTGTHVVRSEAPLDLPELWRLTFDAHPSWRERYSLLVFESSITELAPVNA